MAIEGGAERNAAPGGGSTRGARPAAEHDTLVVRLSQMLVKLNNGERLEPRELAREFSVSERTIQRDLNVRMSYLPMERVDGAYRLDPAFLGKLSTKDIGHFATLAGVRGLFPSLGDDFLRDIFDSQMQSAWLVKGHSYEDISGKKSLFRGLESAIVDRRVIGFEYLSQNITKTYAGVEPYKLINHKGIWYLAARHGGKLKTFAFGKIARLSQGTEVFRHEPAIERELQEDGGIWFGEEKKEVVLKVAAPVASYFKRRDLIVNQKIEKELEGGGLIVSTKLATPEQILPIVRYWLPHVRIISPEALQKQLDSEMYAYLSDRQAVGASGT